MSDDLISRQAAIDAIEHHVNAVLGERDYDEGIAYGYAAAHRHIIDIINELQPAQPEIIACGQGELIQKGEGTMMDDLISRQAVIKEFNCCELTPDGGIDVNYAIDFINQLPSAQPEKCEDCGNFNKTRLLIPQPERKEGKWVKVTNGRGGHECSMCHLYAPSFKSGEENLSPYCPNCGAQME